VIDWDAVGVIGGQVAALATVLLNQRSNHSDTSRQISEVKAEVKTSNAMSMAQIADANESRRIAQIPKADRTRNEQTHIEELPVTEGKHEENK